MKRLRELAAAHRLPSEAARKLACLLELVASDPSAPTSVTAPGEAVDVHVADSLSALPLLGDRAGADPIVDIGSGAGFPGLVLAVALEPARVDLVEATGRKASFIARAIGRLGLEHARAVPARAEDWARTDAAGRYGLALARAVAPLATVVEYASPLLREGGVLVVWRGGRDPAGERAGALAARELAMKPLAVERVQPFRHARRRYLHVFGKSGATPGGVPRRAGMARKRPFGDE